jgi:hypothetical protein
MSANATTIVVGIISALAGLAVGLIAGQYNVHVAKMQIYAAIVSASRQKWIDNLRDALVEYHVLIVDHINARATGEEDAESASRWSKIMQVSQRFRLMLNPDETDHQELIQKVELAADRARRASIDAREKRTGRTSVVMPDREPPADEATLALNEITKHGQRILKREWNRVKSGEPEKAAKPGRHLNQPPDKARIKAA